MSLGRCDLTVIIPAYNEEAALAQTLQALRQEVRLAGATVIVVDDGSTDRTAAIAEEHGAVVICHGRNRGYGASLKAGVRAAKTELVVWFDADGQHDPADLADMVDRLQREQADAIFGARTADSHFVRRRQLGKMIIKLAAERVAGKKIPDVNCGLRVFRRRLLVQYLRLLPNGFSASTTCTLVFLERNYRVVFHPIRAHQRIGQSTVRQLRDGARALHTILRILILFYAFRTFTLMAAVLTVSGLIYGGTMALLAGQGLPVFAALLVILGFQVFCIGIVCDQVSALRLDLLESRADEPDASASSGGPERLKRVA